MKGTKNKLSIIGLTILMTISTLTFSQTKKDNMETVKKETIGLLVLLKAKSGKEEAVKQFLNSALKLVNEEPQTEYWYAFQIDNNTFGIFDTFSKEEGRQTHLSGKVAEALMANAGELLNDFNAETDIQTIDLLANNKKTGEEKKGLLVIMKAKADKSSDVENFLYEGEKLVKNEPNTVSWYAAKMSEGTYVIFDTFTDDSGRDSHLNGQIAATLMENAPVILEGFETSAIQTFDILASK
jgi:quinol monooxygenase YgiN